MGENISKLADRTPPQGRNGGRSYSNVMFSKGIMCSSSYANPAWRKGSDDGSSDSNPLESFAEKRTTVSKPCVDGWTVFRILIPRDQINYRKDDIDKICEKTKAKIGIYPAEAAACDILHLILTFLWHVCDGVGQRTPWIIHASCCELFS